jgi:hypothetical protein
MVYCNISALLVAIIKIKFKDFDKWHFFFWPLNLFVSSQFHNHTEKYISFKFDFSVEKL